ncbi:hypothetical protein HPB51_006631 [Rhipicephalus microplus]|uniref:Peptidase M13 N-terminal domain-containing protein n=1 Tax=Rhipicephalus microplus TaxID=6941 RepID=A0A9J6E6U6_RHIMP|nr:hypothetical protein HPB51_006631 [Rhipicephalus microplus]
MNYTRGHGKTRCKTIKKYPADVRHQNSKVHTSQATQNLPCIGQECHEVAEFIESLMDDSVNPCTDLYRHVCARWIKDTKRPSSFMTDAAQDFSETLHEALSRAYLHGENHELMQNAAIFYNSCLTYLEKDARIKATTDELFEALNISVSKWLIRDDPMQFFRDVLRLSLVHRFHTLLAFIVIEDSGIVSLKVTRWYPLHNFIPPGHMDRLKEYVSRFITVVGKDKASDARRRRDSHSGQESRNFTNANDSEQRLQDAECETFPAKTWIEVLRQELSLTENVPIIVSGMYTICKELNEVLVQANLKKKAVLCNSGKKVTPTDFVSNVVNLYVRDIKNCLLPSVDSRADLGLKQLLLGTDLAAHRSIIVVPPTFTVPPWYYRHVEDDKYINIAMIQDCYARHSASLHTKLNDTQFDHAFSVMESLRVAYEVKRHYDRDLVSRYKPRLISSNLLFYKRACLMLCTTQDTTPFDLHTTDFETAYASCILAAANAPTFIDIFGCDAGDTMTVISSCYVH